MKVIPQSKVLVFAASNSSRSINLTLVKFAASMLQHADVELIDIASYSAPIYSADTEHEIGIPNCIQALHRKFREADAFVIASPEHNGLMPAFFKNTIDWLSRIDQQVFNSRPVALLSTSAGSRGGAGNLRILAQVMVWWGAQIIGTYSLASYNEKFDKIGGAIIDPAETQKLKSLIQKLESETHLIPKS